MTRGKRRRPGDALITREPGVLLIVQTADCVPILLADTKNKAIAAIHSGWRGTLARIAEKTLGQMRMEFGTASRKLSWRRSAPPSAAAATKWVPRWLNSSKRSFPKRASGSKVRTISWPLVRAIPTGCRGSPCVRQGTRPPPLRVHLDLIAANRAILEAAGVPERQHFLRAATAPPAAAIFFFSYRRESIDWPIDGCHRNCR